MTPLTSTLAAASPCLSPTRLRARVRARSSLLPRPGASWAPSSSATPRAAPLQQTGSHQYAAGWRAGPRGRLSVAATAGQQGGESASSLSSSSTCGSADYYSDHPYSIACTTNSHTPTPDDVVIVGAVRTACCKAKKGAFKDTPPDELVVAVMKELLRRTGVAPEEVEDVCLGSVFPPSSKRVNECRQALLVAGFPASLPVYTVNRQCAAGLQAIADVAAAIRAGYIDVGIAGGVEHMTVNPLEWEGSTSPRIQEVEPAKDVLLPLGLTAENVAEEYGVAREVEDALAAASHAKAAAAQRAGKFKDEIVPVDTVWKDPITGEEKSVTVDSDDTIRPDTSAENLAKLKPVFKKGGSVTAGNSCQNTDAAAALLLMTRREADRRGLPVMATLRSFATVGVPPKIMGTAPALAIPKALEKAGLSSDDIDVFELNEAFASQTAYVRKVLALDEEKVNPNGGAIALGHPAGATGARLVVSLLHELGRRNGNGNGNGDRKPKRGVVSLCTGAGMGAAAVFEQEAENEWAKKLTASMGS